MLDQLDTRIGRRNGDEKLSILIPTWNNLPYLKLVLKSLRLHSVFDHHIIVLINEGKDGTVEYMRDETDLDYIHCKENVGVCFGLNIARTYASTPYLFYANDDMYFLPGWDKPIMKEIEAIGHDMFMLSSNLIQPFDTGEPLVLVKDYGAGPDSFEEQRILKECPDFSKEDWNGSTWPPNVMPVKLWDLVGGMSAEFHPGVSSDWDFSAKCWMAGVRYFKTLGDSFVYHFVGKSTSRMKWNPGRDAFLNKWGMTPRDFRLKYLRIKEPWNGPLAEVTDFSPFIPTLKRLSSIKRHKPYKHL